MRYANFSLLRLSAALANESERFARANSRMEIFEERAINPGVIFRTSFSPRTEENSADQSGAYYFLCVGKWTARVRGWPRIMLCLRMIPDRTLIYTTYPDEVYFYADILLAHWLANYIRILCKCPIRRRFSARLRRRRLMKQLLF